MGVRPWIAAVIAAAVGLTLTACVFPLAGLHPLFTRPDLYYRFSPHGSEWAPAPIAFAGAVIVTISVGVYFWLTDVPKTIRYRPRRDGRRQPGNGGPPHQQADAACAIPEKGHT